MAQPPGADPSNLWGNARGGSDMTTRLSAPARGAPSEATTALSASAVARRFADTVALEGLDLTVAEGEVVAVVGPSGCGKSTLLELFAGLQEPDSGRVEAAGAAAARDRIAACAFMPQRDLLMPWRDALGNAGLALECQGASKPVARAQAGQLFERFGFGDFEHAHPAELSGGM